MSSAPHTPIKRYNIVDIPRSAYEEGNRKPEAKKRRVITEDMLFEVVARLDVALQRVDNQPEHNVSTPRTQAFFAHLEYVPVSPLSPLEEVDPDTLTPNERYLYNRLTRISFTEGETDTEY